VSPEILKGDEYDEKIDIWALGVILFEMLFGEDPFKIKREEELVKIVKSELKLPEKIKLSKDAHNFLMHCLQKNPAKRMDINELLLHPFIKPL
jgi:serine/threonine protein kinase